MAEFDRLAPDYQALLKDPIRDPFAPDATFFVTRKVQVLGEFAAREGIDRRRATWLDVGCGTGDLLRMGRDSFQRALGCDVSAGMLEACADLEVTLQDDPLRLPYGDATIDWLTAVCVFHHVEPGDRPPLIREMMRVLRPGGIVAVIEHNPFNPAVQIIVRRTPVDANARLLSARQARTLLRTGGVTVVDTRYFLLLPEAVHRRLGALESALGHVPLGGQYAVFGRRAA